VSREGKAIRTDCQLCHTIIGQENNVSSPTEVAAAETFEHPWPLLGKHAQLTCNQCHWRGRGLVAECTTCHARLASAPMSSFPCAQCHLKEQNLKPLMECATCHPARAELHLKPTHSAVECMTCHKPHEWRLAGRDTCLSCHGDRTEHNAGVACAQCHAFRQLAKSS
jgi:hypothetical protein